AMMAFFLLLWLLNVTTEDQKNAISNYFDPSHPKVSDVMSGAGGILGGLSMSPIGAMVSTVQPLTQVQQNQTSAQGSQSGNKSEKGEENADILAEEALRKIEDSKFQKAAEQLKAEIAKSADLKDLQKNLMIDITPEGLRIQIVDDKGRSMFPSGSAAMYDFMRELLIKVTGVVTPMTNPVSVRGHTDSSRYRNPNGYDNWNLSADRAQASRRVMVQAGLPENRIENVMGRADREPLDTDPASPRNRRISIILMREKPSKDAKDKMKKELAQQAADKIAAQEAAKGAASAGGLTIIDDTAKPTADNAAAQPPVQTQTPSGAAQQQTQAKGDSNAPAVDTLEQQNNVPLPTTPDDTISVPRGPQVMVFGDAPPPASSSLYEGPKQSPYKTVPVENPGPPRITTPVFKTGKDTLPETSEAAPAAAPETKGQKSLTFGDPAPAPAAPKQRAALPAAPDMEISNPQSAMPQETPPKKAATPGTPSSAALPLQAAPDVGGNKELTF
ncbi:MAG: OmpA family protein, partial [Alphaproteobacteria bacterium]|nr:OmpA family protein [Alphaproteobacteria bacterium]